MLYLSLLNISLEMSTTPTQAHGRVRIGELMHQRETMKRVTGTLRRTSSGSSSWQTRRSMAKTEKAAYTYESSKHITETC